jgi:uncharacterized LabA/DUF88 family protein
MPGRSDDTYLFIDGRYLRNRLTDAMQVFQNDGDISFRRIMDEARAKRAFYYDCIDDEQKQGESEEVFNNRIAAQQSEFEKIQKLRGYHVRLGSIKGKAKGKDKTRRQKEVDVLLAVDMLTHGYDGNMESAVLIAGDLDFRPVVEALVRRGVFVEVWYDPKSIAAELPGAADFGRRLTLRELYGWNSGLYQNEHTLPHETPAVAVNVHGIVRAGRLNDRQVLLFKELNDPGFVLQIDTPQGLHTYRHPHQVVLERYSQAVYGSIDWEK